LEIEAGLYKLGRTSPGRQHTQLVDWFDVFIEQFTDRVLTMDLNVARIAATVADQNAARGLEPGFPDIVIAATAVAHSMTLLTRNVRHFSASGMAVIDPFEHLPP
jgi:predicted nucleic acid-binding protein